MESTRLTRLVKEIVDLSRLQVADTLHEPELVDVGAVVAEAVDRVRVAAEARQITHEVSDERACGLRGCRAARHRGRQPRVTNAVNYSEAGTRVGVAARRVDDTVEITVTDQGQGIPAAEQERIFERFYRVDAARSRATGGTGLGLAIVKHVCANHGGEVACGARRGTARPSP